ncbi:hypothetical protein M2105_004716 [Paenibacillus sp. PastF-1]|nr:hypothetical protein [Paenibacillus sp. PastF-2]MDF9850218.1 hypothetical protein [Paenibacillus sp. PastM-2]MDF9856841.1 hypothetical protein [Paenibacillus sp. PastF-1]MDH6482065.1 hypothetical protein [Paenibacillus sp. PastH-2]MDH6509489.1 hypothetical protein [Paenibacillus sp. PastM-3]
MELINIGVAGVRIMGMNHFRTLDKMKIANEYDVFPFASFSELLKKWMQ